MKERNPLAETRFLWCDSETTGLEVGKEKVLEVAFVLTTQHLEVIDSVTTTVWDAGYEEAWDNAIPFVREMHVKNGLIDEAFPHGLHIAEAEQMLADFFVAHSIGADDPLCGSSVQFDRGHLTRAMPSLMASISYRNIDVSTIKEIGHRVRPDVMLKRDIEWADTEPAHRAEPDCYETISEFDFYLKNGLWA